MSLATDLRAKLRLPVMAGPMFIASTADLVIAQCKAGIIGAMPALNPCSTAALDEDVARIRETVGDRPYCINLVAHRTNERLQADLDVILRHKVPIVVLALAANPDLVKELQANGALVFQDVIKNRHAQKCAEMGVDGIIAVGAGAGGHTGDQSPFALMQEIREWWDGLLILSGCIANGRSLLAAEVLGADLAYIGSAFLASDEANTQAGFKQMIVDCSAADITVTNCFTGVNANFLLPSILKNGLDPKNLQRPPGGEINISGGGANSKAWRDIWSAGQGIGAIKRSEPAAAYIDWLADDYAQAKTAMGVA
ncbi:NAD(P)H-dependent flavin oxidoreductase [Sphingomonas psychrolutea]|uniref:2-nitropropane dioxygenase n=1 Tax=Sphingomonas psychrolutea TaxID=1259676 RepID=A0ABQ1GWN5_9SPHN|nr:nitronate monooxygenase [Sphingomonas psychrolutea]GGA51618.1 2-nitropropane dioxygenase [Sphingomonas psychrolutea]